MSAIHLVFFLWEIEAIHLGNKFSRIPVWFHSLKILLGIRKFFWSRVQIAAVAIIRFFRNRGGQY